MTLYFVLLDSSQHSITTFQLPAGWCPCFLDQCTARNITHFNQFQEGNGMFSLSSQTHVTHKEHIYCMPKSSQRNRRQYSLNVYSHIVFRARNIMIHFTLPHAPHQVKITWDTALVNMEAIISLLLLSPKSLYEQCT
jgi:hypothetical protein